MLTTFSGRRPSQNELELRGFIGLLAEHGVRRYLEIGSREGDTFHEVMLALPEGATGVAVDLPGGLWGKSSTRQQLPRAIEDLQLRGRKASCLFGDSQTDATKRLIVGRGPYDAALIDGDHTYAGVSRDWVLYRGIAPMVAFHDIVGDGCSDKHTGAQVEVPRLWAEIKDSGLRTVEFVSPGSKMGIGVVWST